MFNLFFYKSLVVLLHSNPTWRLVACTAALQVLLSLDLESEPDLILLQSGARDEKLIEEIRQIKSRWPAHCLVLVENDKQRAIAERAGADRALLKGVSPKRLLDTIQQFEPADNDNDTSSAVSAREDG